MGRLGYPTKIVCLFIKTLIKSIDLNFFNSIFVPSGALDQSPPHAETKPQRGPLLPHTLPLVLETGQQLVPEERTDEGGADG